MKGTHVLSLITAILWALLILTGIRGIDSVRSQHISGWPSPGQVHYYVYIPAIMLTLIVSAWALAVRWQRVKVFAVTLIVLALLALPVYLLAYTGGI
jgi:O-antigen ligase